MRGGWESRGDDNCGLQPPLFPIRLFYLRFLLLRKRGEIPSRGAEPEKSDAFRSRREEIPEADYPTGYSPRRPAAQSSPRLT